MQKSITNQGRSNPPLFLVKFIYLLGVIFSKSP
nr:MAG TPA: hypothetical protein [Caudoviricetes sp.]